MTDELPTILQCCYYDDLNLVKWNPATGEDTSAGTPDLFAPDGMSLSTVDHFFNDVEPWCDATALDQLPTYMEHRPPSNGGGKSCDGS